MWHNTNVFTAQKNNVAFTYAEYAFIRKEPRALTAPLISVRNVASWMNSTELLFDLTFSR